MTMADLMLHQTVKMGLAAFATKKYFVGDVVLSEEPIMVVKPIKERDDELINTMDELMSGRGIDLEMVDTLIAFLNTPQDKREIILNLYCPEGKPKSKIFMDCELFCLDLTEKEIFKTRYPWATAAILQSFLLIWDINCHGDCLYNVATRLAHSCDPNTFCRSENDSDTISYVAIRDISVGDLVTFSYLGGGPLSLMPTRLRRRRLLSLGFLCSCARCTGPDLMRTMPCPACGAPTCTPLPLPDGADERVVEADADDNAAACYAAPPRILPDDAAAAAAAGAQGVRAGGEGGNGDRAAAETEAGRGHGPGEGGAAMRGAAETTGPLEGGGGIFLDDGELDGARRQTRRAAACVCVGGCAACVCVGGDAHGGRRERKGGRMVREDERGGEAGDERGGEAGDERGGEAGDDRGGEAGDDRGGEAGAGGWWCSRG